MFPATDSPVDEGPEVGDAQNGTVATRQRTATLQRREGTPLGERAPPSREGTPLEGRSVTMRTATGEGNASKGQRQWERLRTADRPSPRAAKSRTGAQKPGEPHDRLQGATNLRSRVRRKLPKSGRTTRAEHVQGVATLGLGQPRVDAHGDVGGGAVFEELQERSLRRFSASVENRTRAAGGPDTFEEEVAGPW